MGSFRTIVQRLRDNLYVVPLVIVAVSIAVARVTTILDHGGDKPISGDWLLSISVAGGRAITASVAGATITVAAFVFSITALSSQIAATQYSPRAVAGFVEDRFQKFVIGLIIGTFVFSLLVLADLSGVAYADDLPHPSLSVTIVLLLGIASAVAIVAYLDHSLKRMRIDAVVRRIAEWSAGAVRHQDRVKGADVDMEALSQPDAQPIRVESTRSGWVLDIHSALLAQRLPADSLARIEVKLGEAVFAGDLLATVWLDGDSASVSRSVQRSVRLGRSRTSSRDPGYGIRQLVDIGLRALSPAVNDPTTAMDVIQHLKRPLREILTLDPPQRVYAGPRRQRVFLPETPSRSDRVRSAFAELRLAAANQPVVLAVLIDVLGGLVEELIADNHESRTVELRRQAELAVDLAKHAAFSASDLEPILDSAKRLGLEPEDEPAD
ncbi:MAG: DUF2254 domain-containing protein [Acidimicrobiia bacterium]